MGLLDIEESWRKNYSRSKSKIGFLEAAELSQAIIERVIHLIGPMSPESREYYSFHLDLVVRQFKAEEGAGFESTKHNLADLAKAIEKTEDKLSKVEEKITGKKAIESGYQDKFYKDQGKDAYTVTLKRTLPDDYYEPVTAFHHILKTWQEVVLDAKKRMDGLAHTRINPDRDLVFLLGEIFTPLTGQPLKSDGVYDQRLMNLIKDVFCIVGRPFSEYDREGQERKIRGWLGKIGEPD